MSRSFSTYIDLAGPVSREKSLFLVSDEEKREGLRDLISRADTPAGRVAAKQIVVIADEAPRMASAGR
jgi:hypothetical protein